MSTINLGTLPNINEISKQIETIQDKSLEKTTTVGPEIEILNKLLNIFEQQYNITEIKEKLKNFYDYLKQNKHNGFIGESDYNLQTKDDMKKIIEYTRKKETLKKLNQIVEKKLTHTEEHEVKDDQLCALLKNNIDQLCKLLNNPQKNIATKNFLRKILEDINLYMKDINTSYGSYNDQKNDDLDDLFDLDNLDEDNIILSSEKEEKKLKLLKGDEAVNKIIYSLYLYQNNKPKFDKLVKKYGHHPRIKEFLKKI
jgi:hypothetical protein